MQPDKPKNSAEGRVALRIPSGRAVFTYLLMFVLLMIAVAHVTTAPEVDGIQAQLGLQAAAVLEGLQYFRLVSALLLVPTPATTTVLGYLLGIVAAVVALYTLYSVGMEMEALWGTPRTLLVYSLGGMFGGSVTLLLAALGLYSREAALATATGGVLAMAGAQVVYLYKHRRLYRAMVPRRQAFLGVLVTLNLVLSALSGRVDFVGTLAACIGGAVLAAFVSPFMLPRQHPDDPNALLAEDVNPLAANGVAVSGFMGLVLLVVVVAVNLVEVYQ
jgi:membrane associated rhomboid family serine protease